MKNMVSKSIALFGCSFLLFGCVSGASIGSKEIDVYNVLLSAAEDEQQFNTLSGRINYAANLSDLYISESDTASLSGDVLALTVIGAAATGAGALVFDGSTDLVKAAGLGAGTTSTIGSYFKPQETSLALLNAAEQLVCMAAAGRDAKDRLILHGVTSAETLPAPIEIIDSGIRQVRLNLRKALVRTRPDYSTVLASLVSASRANGGLATESSASAEEAINKLRVEIAKCALEGVAG